MFKLSDFSIRKELEYPFFSYTIQSWCSPCLGNKKREDDDYSSCITFGISKSDTNNENYLIFASSLHKKIYNSKDLLDHLKCLNGDYLNKTCKLLSSSRNPNIILLEGERGKFNPILKNINLDNVFIFFNDLNGGDNLNDRIYLSMPYLKKVFLSKSPNNPSVFRQDDEEFIGRILAYPNSSSYSMVSAFVQLVIYASQRFELLGKTKSDKREAISHEFY